MSISLKKKITLSAVRYGNGNDPGNSQCDENQYNEGLRIFMNNTNIHDMRDRTGEGISDQYVFAEIRNIPIAPGVTNVLSTEKFIQRQDLVDAGAGFSTDYITPCLLERQCRSHYCALFHPCTFSRFYYWYYPCLSGCSSRC
ncbi:MAG: hypothetical protein KatS3mg087_1421 [Patescibacteria group bacterium]|nr:MAG: hypothetical protein KatS3mg087_1421 [Patescibacteria group bacterium]